RQLPICSKRRPEAIAKTVNQIAKTQKLPAKHINQGFFDPSRWNPDCFLGLSFDICKTRRSIIWVV
ncbi:hypothetical protein, partial [Gluconobacter japonicus]|uniref:hypothetical protein n=1 Tax=Gluconobacter japonicus TaxID=376620 RepID=UPI0024E13A43